MRIEEELQWCMAQRSGERRKRHVKPRLAVAEMRRLRWTMELDIIRDAIVAGTTKVRELSLKCKK